LGATTVPVDFGLGRDYPGRDNNTMKAVVLRGDFDVVVEDRPKPNITAQTDVIVKVITSGLCGS